MGKLAGSWSGSRGGGNAYGDPRIEKMISVPHFGNFVDVWVCLGSGRG